MPHPLDYARPEPRDSKMPWKAAAVVFFGLTLSPGVLGLVAVMRGEIPDDGGAIASILWLLVVVGLILSGVCRGMLEARHRGRR